ncbi:MAG: hypothetical protein HUK03_10350 [Bacteroidaceae bacterium]|nr:hypothetical protein [Bacteroidaceae bacterium]
MTTIEYIFDYAISSMFIGFVLTILGIVCFFLLIKGWYKDRTFNVASILVGVVLFFLLCYQNILLCGTIHMKGMSDMLRERLTEYVQLSVDAGDDYMDSSTVDDLLFQGLAKDFPIISCYVNTSEFTGYRASEIPAAVIDALDTYCNWYIVRRLGWSLLFVVIGAVIVIKTMAKTYTSRKLNRQYTRNTDRREHVSHRNHRR